MLYAWWSSMMALQITPWPWSKTMTVVLQQHVITSLRHDDPEERKNQNQKPKRTTSLKQKESNTSP